MQKNPLPDLIFSVIELPDGLSFDIFNNLGKKPPIIFTCADIETDGHVFQLHFSNATGMNEKAFITNTTGDWGKGEVRFGFNLSRVFTVRRPHH